MKGINTMEENESKANYYTVQQVYDDVFQRTLSKTTIHQMIKKGKIPGVKFCRKTLIPAYWVEDFINKAHTAGSY